MGDRTWLLPQNRNEVKNGTQKRINSYDWYRKSTAEQQYWDDYWNKQYNTVSAKNTNPEAQILTAKMDALNKANSVPAKAYVGMYGDPDYNRPTVKTTSTGAKLTAGTGGSGGYGGSYGASYASFVPSDAYNKAMAYTNQLLEQLSTGRTSYTDKINSMLSAIENKAPFEYDMNNDTLFQNMLNSSMEKGQIAMQDTMGQAAALTGGYGSTYSQAVGNQAYNGYIREAYDKLPDYYNIALNAYNQDLQKMYNDLDMYRTADDVEYSRLAGAYSANAEAAARMYDQEYNNYWQTANFNENSRQWAAEMAYKQAQANRSQSNWEKEYALSVSKANASKQAAEDKANALTDPSSTVMNKALKIYNEQGLKAYETYLASLPNNTDVEQIEAYVVGSNGEFGYGRLPISQRDWTNINDTKNWMGGLDNNDRVQDMYGEEEYSLSELAKIYAEQLGISEKEAKKMLRQYNGAK